MGTITAMTDVLPIIEGLQAAASHRVRADWLLRCPEWVFHAHHLVLSATLREAGFAAGEAYVSAMVAKVSATRLADGSIPFLRLQSVHIASTDMTIAARREG